MPGGLDLNTAEEEEFSPDKMRANIERLYTTVVVGILAAVKHIARLRSWREKERTAWFAGVYFIAWLFDFIMPLITGVIIALIVHPPTRELLFPPAPIALVDPKTGGVQKPWAGTVGSKDSATGAPENHKGEAVEQEADNLVHGLAELAVSSAAGKHPAGDGEFLGILFLFSDPQLLTWETQSKIRPRNPWNWPCGPNFDLLCK